MDLTWVYLIGGLIFVAVGAELLGKSAEGIAHELKRAYVVGAVLLALCGNLPELAISISAIIAGHPTMALASIIGSVAVNILVVLGLCAICGGWKTDLKFDSKKLQADLPLLVGAVGFFIFIMLSSSHEMNLFVGIILIFTYLLLLRFMLFSHKELFMSDRIEKGEDKNSSKSLRYWAMLFVFSSIIVAVSAHFLVMGVEELFIERDILNIGDPEIIEKFVGFTILALAGNLPEHLAAIRAAVNKKGEIAVGNAIGSASQAVYLILGIVIIFAWFFSPGGLVMDIDTIYLAVFAISVLLAIVIVADGKLTWFEGWICVMVYIMTALALLF
ncbi:MAG: hypothetical protein A7316_07660 [Candidatus Altiarchaeales archaeon WOR_SM1_86-2]|nr:MAG: hypothetical protein A7316_07660 [Candidatus Altiarchaeales archaeon WOR_SM1_86-2]